MIDEPMTPEEFAERMRECERFDPEGGHSRADDLMCDVLRSLGYGEGVEIFTNMDRWYA